MHTTGTIKRDRVPDTFTVRHLRTPKQQSTVDSLVEFAEDEDYGVELHRRRRFLTEYTVI